MKFAKFLRASVLKNIYEPLLLYIQVILFTMHEKDKANEMGLELSETYMMELFWGKQLTAASSQPFSRKSSIIEICHGSKYLSSCIRTSEALTRMCSIKKTFAKFTEKHLCRSLFFNKVAVLRQLY